MSKQITGPTENLLPAESTEQLVIHNYIISNRTSDFKNKLYFHPEAFQVCLAKTSRVPKLSHNLPLCKIAAHQSGKSKK
jgi:hypothetical protein